MSIVRFTQAHSLTAISAGSLRRHGEYEMRMQMNTTEYGRARWRGPLKKVQKKEQINGRGEWMVTETANASNGQHARSLSGGRGGGQWWENAVSGARAFREKRRTFLWGILWLRFPLADTTREEVGVTYKVSTQDVFFWDSEMFSSQQ